MTHRKFLHCLEPLRSVNILKGGRGKTFVGTEFIGQAGNRGRRTTFSTNRVDNISLEFGFDEVLVP